MMMMMMIMMLLPKFQTAIQKAAGKKHADFAKNIRFARLERRMDECGDSFDFTRFIFLIATASFFNNDPMIHLKILSSQLKSASLL
jgi:hypothetical protein